MLVILSKFLFLIRIEDMKNDNVALYQEVEKLTEDNNFLAEEVIL